MKSIFNKVQTINNFKTLNSIIKEHNKLLISTPKFYFQGGIKDIITDKITKAMLINEKQKDPNYKLDIKQEKSILKKIEEVKKEPAIVSKYF